MEYLLFYNYKVIQPMKATTGSMVGVHISVAHHSLNKIGGDGIGIVWENGMDCALILYFNTYWPLIKN